MSSASLDPSLFGSWSRFLGCGTNGGTVTLLVLNADGTATFQENKKKGVSGRGENKTGEIVSGVWRIADDEYGPLVVLKPEDGSDDVEIAWEDGRYGFHKEEVAKDDHRDHRPPYSKHRRGKETKSEETNEEETKECETKEGETKEESKEETKDNDCMEF